MTLLVDAELLVSNHAGAGNATVARGGVGSPHAEIAVFLRQQQVPVGGASSSVAASPLMQWLRQAQQQQSVIQVTVDNGRAGALRLLDGETLAAAVQLKREVVRAHPQRYTERIAVERIAALVSASHLAPSRKAASLEAGRRCHVP